MEDFETMNNNIVGQGEEPAQFGGEQTVTPEQVQEMQTLIDNIKQKTEEARVNRTAGENRLESVRSQILKRVFEILQLSGVDLTQRESVSDFLNTLKARNPDLALWFEQSMDVLLGGGETEASSMEGPMEGPMEGGETPDVGALTPPQNQYEETDTSEGMGQTLPEDI